MDAKQIAIILDQLGCTELNIGVGKAIHDLVNKETGVGGLQVVPKFLGRNYYQVLELNDDEIILQIKQIYHCIISYDKLVEINEIFSKPIHSGRIVSQLDNPDVICKDNLDMLFSMDETIRPKLLTVIRE